jgi:hypothetical protein
VDADPRRVKRVKLRLTGKALHAGPHREWPIEGHSPKS